MDENKRTKSNPLIKKIVQVMRKTGFDDNVISAAKFHLDVLYSKTDVSNIKSDYDYCKLLLSKLFIDQIDLYPTKRFECQVNECSGWPVPLLPSEVFGETKISVEYRRSSFYRCLQVGDFLDCRVASVLPTEYQLRVIHKYGVTRILDDLNIIVIMLRDKSELLLLQKELFRCELIRVVVSQIIKEENENKIYVTVSYDSEKVTQCRPQLGRISEEQLPSYVLDPPEAELYSTYSEYLNSLSAFRNPVLLDDIFEGFGIDPRGVYTYYPTCESLKPVDANAFLKESILSDVKHLTDSALQKLAEGDAQTALRSVQMAIKIYPMKNQTETDKVELCKLYEIRGRIHAEMEKPKLKIDAIVDWGLALKKDPSNKCGNEQLSKVLFQASNVFYKKSEYIKARNLAEAALKLNGNNMEALTLVEYLKSKHPEVFLNLDQESLLSLHEKKKELVTMLKKL